jgi:hypothetical protein
MSKLSAQAVKVACGYAAAGVREVGANDGDQVGFFQRLFGGAAGQSWCAYFVGSCYVKAWAELRSNSVNRKLMMQLKPAVMEQVFPFSGYCPAVAAVAKSKGLFRPRTYDAMPGDLVLFDFQREGEPHHIGIVRSCTKLAIYTVEGNTSSGILGSQADGDGVYLRTRLRTGRVFGFVALSTVGE